MINTQDHIDSHRPDVMEVLARFDGKNWLTSVVVYTGEGGAAITVEYITDWPLDRAYLGDAFRVNVSELEAISPGPDGSERLRYRVTPRQDYPNEAGRP